MTPLPSLFRTLPIVAAIGVSALLCDPASAARGGGGHAVAAGWHGGPGHDHGGWGHRGWGYRGWGYRGGYWPGAFWGGIGLGVGIGAIAYYGGYGSYYGSYWGPYYGPYYGAYYDAPVVVAAPAYGVVEPGAPRAGQPVPQASAAPDPIFYPKNGQSPQATESDRRECNRWATTQPGAMADASIFQRATLACMEGRGYTVK